MDNPIFEIHKDKVSLTDEGFNHPEFNKLYEDDKELGKKVFGSLIEYIYFAYSKKSTYFNMLPDDRKKIICADRFKGRPYVDIESISGVTEAINKLNALQYTPREAALEGAKRKIGEYIKFWETTSIDAKNHELVQDTLKGVELLLKVQEKLEKQVLEQATIKAVGGGKSNLFED